MAMDSHASARTRHTTPSITCDEPAQRLEGLEPIPQEFHKRMLCLQDTFKDLFKGSSATDKGTLYSLKNVFNHRTVEKDVSKCFNHAAELLEQATDAYTVLWALDLLHMVSVDDDLPSGSNRETAFIHAVTFIVDAIWFHPDASIPSVVVPTEYDLCKCKTEDDEEPMVQCGNESCPKGKWFHYSCVDITQVDVDELDDDDWTRYCCDDCRQAYLRPKYTLCICKTDMGEDEPMVECSNPKCSGQWFHWVCMGLEKKDIPTGKRKWYCGPTCKPKGGRKKKSKQSDVIPSDSVTVDHKHEYVRALLWHGLNDRVRKHAVQQGDGRAMMTFWKMDLITFFRRNHPKYLILAHRLCAGVAGWLPDKLRQDLIRNRTANMVGGCGNNLPLDLVNEYMNREFLESLAYGGRMTHASVDRHGKMVGFTTEDINVVFDNIVSTRIRGRFDKDRKYTSLTLQMVDYLKSEKLLSVIPGRHFKAFPKFCLTTAVDMSRFKVKMSKLSFRLDRRRRLRR